MRRTFIFSVITISILLSGCLGEAENSNADKKIEGFHAYATDEFKLQIPDEWEVLTPVNFKSDTPKNTLVAFRNNIRNEKFTSNVAIIKNELTADISTLDYAKNLLQKVKNEIFEFKEVQVSDHADGLFIYFEGKEVPTGDLKRFVQVAGVKGKTAYIAIGAFLTSDSEDTAKKIEEMIKSFEVK